MRGALEHLSTASANVRATAKLTLKKAWRGLRWLLSSGFFR
jgi:hypothetical protein